MILHLFNKVYIFYKPDEILKNNDAELILEAMEYII
jgi:hypothetical protein